MHVDKEECSPRPPSHSHRTRENLCSFPITGTPPPLSREKDRPSISIRNYKKHPLSGFSREIFPRLYTAKNTPFPEKIGMRMRPPRAFEWGEGGCSHKDVQMHVFNRRITSTLKNCIISLTSLRQRRLTRLPNRRSLHTFFSSDNEDILVWNFFIRFDRLQRDPTYHPLDLVTASCNCVSREQLSGFWIERSNNFVYTCR